ncbi:9962_t:CDS:1, partial [Entrophospora sp. SA101]
WILMNDLVVVLKDFEEITRKLSGATYITFSLIYPSIYTLIKKLQEMLPESSHLSIDNEFEDSSEQLQLDEQEDVFNIQDILEDEEADEILILDSNTKKKINISSSIETDGLKDLIIEALLIYLKKYWDAPSDLSMVATILDPRLKKLSIFEEKDVKTTIFNLKEEHEISCINNLQNEACEDSESLIDLRNNDAFGSSIVTGSNDTTIK